MFLQIMILGEQRQHRKRCIRRDARSYSVKLYTYKMIAAGFGGGFITQGNSDTLAGYCSLNILRDMPPASGWRVVP